MGDYQAVFRRKEIKYVLSGEQLKALMPILLRHMVPDEYAHSSIYNLYYDTSDYRMIRRSLEKPTFKEKLRVRCYAPPKKGEPAFIEIKRKVAGVVYKRRTCVGYDDALDYMDGKIDREGQLYREIDWMKREYFSLKPSIYLSCERDSFKGREDESLRVTFDRQIRWQDARSGAYGELLETGQTLMEIKAVGAMPIWMAKTLSQMGAFPTSFSKYGRAYMDMMTERSSKMEEKKYA